MSGANVDANWWAFDHCMDDSGLLVKTVGLEDLKLKNNSTAPAYSRGRSL